MRDLVHATFKDSAGYVEDLTKECVDEYIAEIEAYNKQSPRSECGRIVRSRMRFR